MAENQTDTELGGTILEYPRGISTVPYASFLKITRYEYQEALEKVAANSNDALGAYARSGVMKNLVNTTTNVASTIYNGASFDSDSSLNTMENSINEGKKNSWWDFADVFSFDGTNKT